jgi:hypothetical protein
MPEDFSETSKQSIRALIQQIVAIGNVLKKELPFDYLTQAGISRTESTTALLGFPRDGERTTTRS